MFLPNTNKELIRISNDKLIYIIKDEPNILVKVSLHNDKLIKEINLQIKAHSYVPCPNIIDTIVNEGHIYILMEKLEAKTIYDLYGSNPKDVPDKIWKEIHKIISKLYYHDIHYVDISSFNFMVDKNDKVYIIDFGDAYECKVNWFLKDFMDGEKSWNPDFV